MKKILVLLLILILLFSVTACSSEPVEEQGEEGQETEEAVFEQIGYSKIELDSGSNNRSFVFYTTETDEEKLIEHARQQAWTELGFTYVHYYNDKEKAPDNTLFSAEESFLTEGYDDGRIFVYQKAPNGNEFVYDGNMANSRQLG